MFYVIYLRKSLCIIMHMPLRSKYLRGVCRTTYPTSSPYVNYIYSLLVGSRLPTCRLFSGLLRDWQDEGMCKRHDVGRMKDRESQKPDEGIGIGICYWNRKRWICRRLQYQVRKESEGYTELITLTDSHLHGIRSGQKGGHVAEASSTFMASL